MSRKKKLQLKLFLLLKQTIILVELDVQLDLKDTEKLLQSIERGCLYLKLKIKN